MLENLESEIGYRFADRTLLVTALTHRSYVNETRDPDARDNQQMEFFGDAVIGFLVSCRLLERFPDSREGKLSRIRASLVDEETLSGLASGIGLGRHLLLGKGEDKTGGRQKKSMLADALEALVAAVYLDGGIDAARRVVDRLFSSLLDNCSEVSEASRDAKTLFQELCQSRYGIPPRYELDAVTGPDHDRRYTASVHVGERAFGKGTGRSKKEAEQAAAAEGLTVLERGEADGAR